MEDLAIRILGLAVWGIVVALMMRSLYLTGRSSDEETSAEVNAFADRASRPQRAYVLCYERCLNDSFGNPDRVSLCRASCAI